MLKTWLHIFILSLLISENVISQELNVEECFLEFKRRETRYITEDQHGFIWMMRADGFFRYDGKEIEFIDVTHDFTTPFYHPASSLFEQANGDYWFASRDAGLIIYKADQDRFIQQSTLSIRDTSRLIYIRYITPHPHQAKLKFVSGDQGAWLLDESFNIHKYLDPLTTIDDHSTISSFRRIREIRKMIYDPTHKCLWLGGMAGLLSYHLEQDTLIRYPVPWIQDRYQTTREHYLINDILIDGDQLITTTWFGGLMTFDIPTKTWTSYSFEDQANDLFKSGNTQIAKTSEGNIFVAHEGREVGSWKVSQPFLDSPTVKGKTMARGIGVLVDRLGYLWIGHWGSICRYSIKEEMPQAKTAQIYINKIILDGTLVKQRMSRWDHQTYTLDKPGETLQFVFRAINPLSYDSIQYEYRLEGLQEDWQQNGTSETAHFNRPAAGQFQFQARYFDTISQQYIYSGKVRLIIQKQNQFNQSLIWALLGLLLLGILIFFLYRFYNQRTQRRAIERYEQQLREVQDAALRAQMNPHFLFNSLNSIRYFIVTNDNDKAAGYLTKFSRLIRMILENSKKKIVSLSEELQLLDLYIKMEQIRFEDKFDYEVKMLSSIHPSNILLPPMLIQPYIENAIIHGINPKEGRGKITLTFEKKLPYLSIHITDDGIGRQKSQSLKQQSIFKKESLGLSITKSRLQLVNTKTYEASLDIIDLYDEQQVAIGTEVRIRIPLV